MSFSRSFLSEDQLLCSICLDVFDNPVSTPCGHSFCMACICNYWDSAKHCQCPLCKQNFKRKPDLHINRTLREITEQFKQVTSKPVSCRGGGGGRAVEEEGRPQGSVEETEKPGHLPGDLFTEMKRKFTGNIKSGPEQTADNTDGTQPPVLTREVSMRRFTLSGAANAMNVPLCPKHHRNLELFCRSDLECICVECGQTEHQSHNITCAEKEWQSNKMKISVTDNEIQEMTKERLQKVGEIKQSLSEIKMLGEREMQRSMQFFGALVNSIECSQAGLLEVIEINCRSSEHQAEVIIRELEQEITQLRKRSAALGKVAQIKDYNTGLKSYTDISMPLSMKDWTGVSLTCDLGTKAVYTSVCQLLEQFKEDLQKLPAICGFLWTTVKH